MLIRYWSSDVCSSDLAAALWHRRNRQGFGFPGAGTNASHNLPLPGNPAKDAEARVLFNEGAAALFVAPSELEEAIAALNSHDLQQRVRERDHALADRQ